MPEEERRCRELKRNRITPTLGKHSNYKIYDGVICAKLCCIRCARTHLNIHDSRILSGFEKELCNPANPRMTFEQRALEHCVSVRKLMSLKTWTYEWDSDGAVPWSIEVAKKRSVKPKPKAKPKPAEEEKED